MNFKCIKILIEWISMSINPGRMYVNIILIFMMSENICAQVFNNEIAGYIFDNETGDPVEYVNVYIAHTTRGAATDRNGYYIIKSIPPGNHLLAVSAVGYKFTSEIIEVEENSKIIRNFKLSPEIYDTETINVEGSIPDKWFNDLADFKRLFLGDSRSASKCIIENQEIIEFQWDPPGFLKAKAPKPLIITNNYLGYKIFCVLIDFYWDKNNGNWGWSVAPQFTELEEKNDDEREQWIENREKAYSSSIYHFLYSTVHNQLNADGYEIDFVRMPGDKPPYHSIVEYDALISPDPVSSETKLHIKQCMLIKSRYYKSRISWIEPKYSEATIDKYGYPKEINPFRVYGYWAERGMADQVPKYYNLDSVSEK